MGVTDCTESKEVLTTVVGVICSEAQMYSPSILRPKKERCYV